MIQELKTTIYALASLMAGLGFLAALCAPAYRAPLLRCVIPATIMTQLAAFLSPSLWSFHVLAAVAMPLLARRRELIAPLYLFLLLTLPGVEQLLRVGGAALFTAGVGASLSVGAAVAMMLRRPPAGRRSLLPDLVITALWLFIIVITARDTDTTNFIRVAWEQALFLLLPYFIVSRAVRSNRDLQFALFGLLAATMALASLAVFESLRSWPIYSAVYQHYGIFRGVGEGAKMRAGFLRSSGTFSESTSFGLFLALGFLGVCGGRQFFASRVYWLLSLMLPAIGLLAPQSRGAWVGAIVGVMMLTWYRRDWGGFAKQIAVGGVIMAGSLVGSYMSKSLTKVFASYGELPVAEDYRAALLRRSMEEFWKHPIVGMPPPAVYRALVDLRQGEQIVDFVNTYLYYALTGGFVGLAVVMVVLGTPVLWMLSKRIRLSAYLGNEPGVIFSMLVSLLFMLAFTFTLSKTVTLLVVLLALAGQIRKIAGNSSVSNRVRSRSAEENGTRKIPFIPEYRAGSVSLVRPHDLK